MKHVLAILLLIVLFGGFFMVLQKLSDIEELFQNASLSSASSTSPLSEVVVETPNSTSSDASVITIPTAIIFRTLSSSRLEPQTNIAVIIESVSKDKEGNVSVNLKAFTSEATSYSALELQDMFEIVNISSGNNIRPSDIVGSFNSIPPKSVLPGIVKFRVSPDQRSIILQINAGENPVFYRFFFDQKKYEETTLG